VESARSRTIKAAVSAADLAVHADLAGSDPPPVERARHGGALPDPARARANLYAADPPHSPAVGVSEGPIRRG